MVAAERRNERSRSSSQLSADLSVVAAWPAALARGRDHHGETNEKG